MFSSMNCNHPNYALTYTSSQPVSEKEGLGRDVQFLIWQEMLAVVYHNLIGQPEFDVISKQADRIVTAVVSSYAFLTAMPFQFIRKNWVEAKGEVVDSIVGKSDGQVFLIRIIRTIILSRKLTSLYCR